MATYGYRDDGTELKTQWETVLYYIKQAPGKHRITSGKIWEEFGFTRLSAIVMTISEHTGVRLPRRSIVVKNRYGGKVRVTEYWWPNEEK